MNDIQLLIVIVASVLVTGLLIYAVRSRARYQRNLKIVETLDIIRNTAIYSRNRGIIVPIENISPSFEQLRVFAAGCPPDVLETIDEMERCWVDLKDAVEEMVAHQVGSTLQSSIKVSRSNKLVADIGELAKQLERQLGDKSQQKSAS